MFPNNKTINMTISPPQSYSFNESSSDQIQSPNLFEYFLIFFGLCIFLIGIIGNLLVILVIVKNVHMRSITNIFIGNLAIGDFCVVLMCLPATLITDITGNWWFGKTMCKIIPYIQYISVCVSVLTLTSISYERYYAIVFPLKLKATKFRAKIIILLVWTLAVLINLPHPLVITLIEENGTF
jgi:hypocretin (orexin) receptor 2